ncbi:hypothetical protein YC2023_018552 [Brassica napus]
MEWIHVSHVGEPPKKKRGRLRRPLCCSHLILNSLPCFLSLQPAFALGFTLFIACLHYTDERRARVSKILSSYLLCSFLSLLAATPLLYWRCRDWRMDSQQKCYPYRDTLIPTTTYFYRTSTSPQTPSRYHMPQQACSTIDPLCRFANVCRVRVPHGCFHGRSQWNQNCAL